VPLPVFALDRPDLSLWRAGNTGTTGVWQFMSPRPGPSVALAALIHGNELCGAWAAAGLLESLHRGPGLRCGRLTVAFCNLDAFDRFDPRQPDASRFVEEDMNRVWRADRLAHGSTRERRRAAELLPWLAGADVLLDLHSMHEPGSPLLLTGPLPRHVSLVRELALGGHVVIDTGHADGVRLRDYGRYGDPASSARALLIECGWHGDVASRRVAQDATLRLLLHTGLLTRGDLPDDWQRAAPPAQWQLEVTGAVRARSMGFRFVREFENLECIAHRGAVIADNDGEVVTTPYDDCVLVMPSVRQLRAGVTVVRLARRMALV
jgi:predicted deacylase